MAPEFGVGARVPLCRRHRWTFIRWMREARGRPSQDPGLVHRIDSCRCCALARVTSWRNGVKAGMPVYADTLNEAILGAKLSECEGELVLSRMSFN